MQIFPLIPKNLRSIALLVSAAIIFSACSAQGAVKGVTSQPVPKKNVTKEIVHLTPVDGLDQFGTATIEDLGNKTVHVLIHLDHAGTSVLPASLNLGSCASIGDVKVPLQDVKGGNSDNTLTGISMKEVQILNVVIYHPQGDPRPTVCGLIE